MDKKKIFRQTAKRYLTKDSVENVIKLSKYETLHRIYEDVYDTKYEDMLLDGEALNSLRTILARIKYKEDEIVEEKINSVTSCNNTVTTITSKKELSTRTIQTRKIESIKFSSDSTVNTLNKIDKIINYQSEFVEDYLFYLNGGTNDVDPVDGRKRHELSHIKLHKKLRVQLNAMAEEITSSCSMTFDVDDIKEKMAQLKLIKQLSKTIKEIDLEPLETLSSLGPMLKEQQQVIQGAIVNDRTMLENGNIVLDEEEINFDQATKADISEDTLLLTTAIEDLNLINLGATPAADPQITIVAEAIEDE